MSHELEDVIVLDQGARKVYNFSDIVSEALKEEALTDNFDSLLKPGQIRLGVDYFTEEEVESAIKMALENGGIYLERMLLSLHHLPYLPEHSCTSTIPLN